MKGWLDFGLCALDVGGGHFRDGQACNAVARGGVENRTALVAQRSPVPAQRGRRDRQVAMLGFGGTETLGSPLGAEEGISGNPPTRGCRRL